MSFLSLQKCTNEQEIISVLRNMYLTRTHEDFHTHVTEMMHNIQSLYHNDGNSPWSDEQYDIIVDVLKNEFDRMWKIVSNPLAPVFHPLMR